ncbi:MAG: hypothetical protein ABR606_16630, partial [Vicinamibacterales bacterium]
EVGGQSCSTPITDQRGHEIQPFDHLLTSAAAGSPVVGAWFSGELFIYYVLIALGGGVLTAFTMMMFNAIDIDAEWLAEGWLIPCGAMGAVIAGSWLVEAKQSVIENMAPVLTRLFTPLFTVVLLAFLATMA